MWYRLCIDWASLHAQSCVGIRVIRTLEEARNASASTADCASIIFQKYVENPLLIQQRKFDVRQFALVTSLQPLEVYIYSDFYVRFCTEAYSTEDVSPYVCVVML